MTNHSATMQENTRSSNVFKRWRLHHRSHIRPPTRSREPRPKRNQTRRTPDIFGSDLLAYHAIPLTAGSHKEPRHES